MNDNQTRKGLVTVFGGSGFIGRHVVRALAGNGWRVRIACRRPDRALDLQSLGEPDQIDLVQANLRDPQSIAAALEGAEAAVNLVGILIVDGNRLGRFHGCRWRRWSGLHNLNSRLDNRSLCRWLMTNHVGVVIQFIVWDRARIETEL